MASHRAQLISTLLANALAFGHAEIHPEREPLKVNLGSRHPHVLTLHSFVQNLDTNVLIDLPDTPYELFIGVGGDHSVSREHLLTVLRTAWEGHATRQHVTEDEWITGLTQHLEKIVNLRIDHVREWLDQNLSRFRAVSGGGSSHARIDDLQRHFESAIVELKGSVQLCRLTCAECHLRCVQNRVHDGAHDCQSDHVCVRECDFCLALEPEGHRSCAMK